MPPSIHQPAIHQPHFAGPGCLDQGPVMGGDQHGSAQPVQFREQADQPRPISGSTLPVGSSAIKRSGRAPRRGRWRHAAARRRQGGRRRVHAITQSDPGQKLLHVMGVIRDAFARQRQRQRHIVESRQVISSRKSWNTTRYAAQARQVGPLCRGQGRAQTG